VGASSPPLGWWDGDETPNCDPEAIRSAVREVRRPVTLLWTRDRLGLTVGGCIRLDAANGRFPVAAMVPACPPQQLGDPSFLADHGLKYPYVAGAMANGIGSADICEAMGRAGMLGFFGAAGLDPNRVDSAIDRLQRSLGDIPFGFNLIHSPNEPHLEAKIVDLYLRRGIKLVEASAYLDLTLPVVKYRVHGIHRDEAGKVVAPNRIIAKVSRVEVAAKFFAPPPEKYLRELVQQRF